MKNLGWARELLLDPSNLGDLVEACVLAIDAANRKFQIERVHLREIKKGPTCAGDKPIKLTALALCLKMGVPGARGVFRPRLLTAAILTPAPLPAPPSNVLSTPSLSAAVSIWFPSSRSPSAEWSVDGAHAMINTPKKVAAHP